MKYLRFFMHTLIHKTHVFLCLLRFSLRLIYRGLTHDLSKLFTSELYWYGQNLPLFKTAKYGTPEYFEILKNFQHSLDHHYSLNSHHPEHYPGGYTDMALVDLVEMFCDWEASSKKRMGTGSFAKSIEINKERFNMSDDIIKIFKNSI